MTVQHLWVKKSARSIYPTSVCGKFTLHEGNVLDPAAPICRECFAGQERANFKNAEDFYTKLRAEILSDRAREISPVRHAALLTFAKYLDSFWENYSA